MNQHPIRSRSASVIREAIAAEARGEFAFVTRQGVDDGDQAREVMVRRLVERGLLERQITRRFNRRGDLRATFHIITTDAGRAALAEYDARVARDALPTVPRSGIKGRTVGLAVVCSWLQTLRPDGELAARSLR